VRESTARHASRPRVLRTASHRWLDQLASVHAPLKARRNMSGFPQHLTAMLTPMGHHRKAKNRDSR